ncbi:hypothetical protein C9374_010782 [Naegleria lovaniensis]|uniref:Uncharacterized protein n=1 Tax=Naegleria lovaniensis TaxID=51637 RepID=A0AA88GG01_NAELO|nr:uncharacterized protein C9374_010782 [Naegleria lovaniensis]KAG2374498.1 hypothetical protein C9374_010782 [Naegleria lovaniensis]
MPRQYVRGGPWKNSEDEILKAAVMKYGKNQWARVASLLNRKSPKQCKARWFEWLDPSIKKTEWTREEEEKLLHLAKIMPSQWRSIAPIVGRTASQCLEHYERMLDEEQRKQEGATESSAASSSSTDDPRKLRVGEIDPNPETKPARPDAIDMDEDELEMLNEARARLANTRGKKAKRKLREQKLEEARRVTATQKKRELKAAGLLTNTAAKLKKRKLKHPGSDVNYNREIPFYKKPAPGFYDTAEEDKKTVLLAFEGNSMQALEQVQNEQTTEKEKKKDKVQVLLDKNLPQIIKKIDDMSNAKINYKKIKLALPPPQITDAELDQIVKMGKKLNTLPATSLSSNQATKQLMGDYKPNATPLIQATRTPMRGDVIGERIREIQQIQSTPTPIQLSRERESAQLTIPQTLSVASTPSQVKATPIIHQTPFRDQLHINTPGYGAESLSEDLQFHKQQLKEGFANLPTPTGGDFVVFKNAKETEEAIPKDFTKKSIATDDAGVKEKDQRKQKLASKQQEMYLKTSVVKRHLPKPSTPSMDLSIFSHSKEIKQDTAGADVNTRVLASELIATEMRALVNSDISGERAHNLGLPEHLLLRARIELAMENFAQPQPSFEEFNKVYHACTIPISEEQAIELLRQPWEQLKQEISQFTSEHLKTNLSKHEMVKEYVKKTSIEIAKASRELDNYKQIQEQERRAIPSRLSELQEEGSWLSSREKELQERYKALLDEKEQLKIIHLDDIMMTANDEE